MAEGKRSYRQYCGLAKALDVVGERWTLLLVRNLLLGPRRYSDFLAELPGLTTNLLAKRLQELEAAGIVEKVTLAPPAASTVYRLTEAGAALEPVVMELARWGGRYMGKPKRDDTVNLAWGMLVLRRRYRGGLTLVVGIEADARRFELAFTPGYLRVLERAAERPEVVVRGSEKSIRALLLGHVASADLLKTGSIHIDGDRASFEAMLQSFGYGEPLASAIAEVAEGRSGPRAS